MRVASRGRGVGGGSRKEERRGIEGRRTGDDGDFAFETSSRWRLAVGRIASHFPFSLLASWVDVMCSRLLLCFGFC